MQHLTAPSFAGYHQESCHFAPDTDSGAFGGNPTAAKTKAGAQRAQQKK